MGIRYSLRLNYPLTADSRAVEAQLVQLCHDTRADEITLMIFCEAFNRGHETLDEIRQWLALIRPWKETLQRQGVTVSLNPWITVLHCDRGRRLKSTQLWQTMVDWRGQAAQAVVCPLDPGWRAYYREALALYAAEGFRVIWLEDDIRLANHAPLDWGGCFCPLHVAEFNRRAGTTASRDEIVARLLQPGEPHPWRRIWLDMWDETQTQMVAEFRAVVEQGGAQLGLMSSEPAMHAMEGRHWSRWWQALSGDRPPVHRPHFWGYGDAQARQLPVAIHLLDMNRNVEPDGCEVGPEFENFPQGWSKSLRQTAAQMVLAVAMGSDRLNLSLYDYLGQPPEDTPAVAPFLAAWKPTLDWLTELFPPSLRSQGIGCPWSEGMTYGRHATPDARDFMAALHTPSHGWPAFLTALGQPCQMRASAHVNALAGDMVWAFGDSELRDLLARGLLLDGAAALNLQARGFGAWLGLEGIHWVTQQDKLYSVEELADPRFALRPGALVLTNYTLSTQRLVQGNLAAGAQAVSRVCGPRLDPIGPGAVIHENALGGRVAIYPWEVTPAVDDAAQLNVHRAAQLRAVVGYLAGENAPGSVQGSPWLVPLFMGDGRRWRGVIWNACPDDAETVEVRLPAAVPGVAEAVQIDARGARRTCRFEQGQVHLPQPLRQWECVVLVGA